LSKDCGFKDNRESVDNNDDNSSHKRGNDQSFGVLDRCISGLFDWVDMGGYNCDNIEESIFDSVGIDLS